MCIRDRHMHLVENLQHADMRRAARAAAAEHEPYARPLTFGSMHSLGEQKQADGYYRKQSHRGPNSSSSFDRETAAVRLTS